jgi:NADPH:quinone reductase-like Zn-dependent oxidoreductase
MPPTNTAALLPTKQAHPFTLGPAPYTPPGPNELLIRARAAAINPADYAIQAYGALMDSFPAILGCDVAGEVVEVGETVGGKWKVGDRVVGPANCLRQRDGGKEGEKVYAYSAFQEYVLLEVPMVARVPEGTRWEEAVVLPLAVNTAASCLFQEGMLGLGMPDVKREGRRPGEGKILIVWAASASVGNVGVQWASLAGYKVVGIASERNHGLVREAGARVCFDQKDGDVVGKVVEWAKEDGGEVVGAYDAWSRAETIKPLCEILGKVGGRKFIGAVFMNAEDHAQHGVEVKTNFAMLLDKETAGKAVWEVVDAALADGRLKCLPRPEVVGYGLDKAQEGVDLIGKGVSGKKLVITF